MEFTVLGTTPHGTYLLEASGEPQAIAKPTAAFLGKNKVGTISETIASIARPYYLLRPAPGTQPRQIVGKKITTK
jgi:rRNA processing protein Gar1